MDFQCPLCGPVFLESVINKRVGLNSGTSIYINIVVIIENEKEELGSN